MSLPQQLRLTATGSVSAAVDLPGSKSITNRAFIIGALAVGESVIKGALHSDDTVVMSECLGALGVPIVRLESETSLIRGSGGVLSAPPSNLFVGNSGTTVRFLTAIASLTSSGTNVVLDGVPRMRQRPIADLITALLQLGVTAKSADNGCPPVYVEGGGIKGGSCTISGAISSQYLSAVLLAAPYARELVRIIVDGDLVSKPYIDITIAMMKEFGVDVVNHAYSTFDISAPQKYSGREYQIEPDASNASYFLAAAAVTSGSVTVNNLGTSSIQGDVAFIDVLEMMGCEITRKPQSITVSGPSELTGIDFDASRIPDMAQTIAVVACFAAGPTRLTGLRTLRVKETDRITAMANELRKIGASVDEGPDFLVIRPAPIYQSAAIDTYDDHRMAMSFAVAGLKIDGLTINDPGCVAKTFPDFWNRWESAFPHSLPHEVCL